MNVDVMLDQALTSVGLPAYPNTYTGKRLEYLTWNYTEIPAVYAERAPRAARYLIQVHYYLPHKEDPSAKKQLLRNALFNAGCTWPSIENSSESEGQHWVFECEYANGGGFYGQT